MKKQQHTVRLLCIHAIHLLNSVSLSTVNAFNSAGKRRCLYPEPETVNKRPSSVLRATFLHLVISPTRSYWGIESVHNRSACYPLRLPAHAL